MNKYKARRGRPSLLSPVQKLACACHSEFGFTASEMGNKVGVSESTVRNYSKIPWEEAYATYKQEIKEERRNAELRSRLEMVVAMCDRRPIPDASETISPDQPMCESYAQCKMVELHNLIQRAAGIADDTDDPELAMYLRLGAAHILKEKPCES